MSANSSNSVIFPPLLDRLLKNRGLTETDLALSFLNPDYDSGTHDPYLLKDMAKAADRIVLAVRNNQRIAIYSDYDADGIPGAVILHDFFRKIGFDNFENYIPDRHEEGFGLNIKAVEELASRGAKLIITIDCGIVDVLPVARASELGVNTIITDHHEPNGDLPPAFAIINPKQADCGYPFKSLCGAGVIYKLIQAILINKDYADLTKNIVPGWEKWLLDMVGLATLSDMVPLVGENRVLARYGLLVLRKSPRVGLMKLLNLAKTNQRFLNEDDVGFTITPRINAASRMGAPKNAFELLATTDELRAGELIDYLNRINDERKGLVASIIKDVKARILERETEGLMREVIVMGHVHWKPTVLGLVANSLKDDHARPVFLWGKENSSNIKGSCRSDGRVNVVELMEANRELFVTFGGHKMSGGFVIEQEKIHFLEESLVKSYKALSVESVELSNDYDAELELDQVNSETCNLIERLSPFGVGNPKPVFLFRDLLVSGSKLFGQNKNHVEVSFKNSSGRNISAISFFVRNDDPLRELKPGDKLSLKASIEKSYFKNYPEIRLRIVSI